MDRSAVIEVADNGVGIPDVERPRIFDRFYRVLIAHTENVATDGSGLGLAIVKSICDRYAGIISVEAAAGGRGSIFRVR